MNKADYEEKTKKQLNKLELKKYSLATMSTQNQTPATPGTTTTLSKDNLSPLKSPSPNKTPKTPFQGIKPQKTNYSLKTSPTKSHTQQTSLTRIPDADQSLQTPTKTPQRTSKHLYLFTTQKGPNRLRSILLPGIFLAWVLPITILMCFSFKWPILLLTNLTIWTYLETIFYLFSALFYAIKPPPLHSARYHLHRMLHMISLVTEVIVVSGYWPFAFQVDLPNYPNNCRSPMICYVFTCTAHGVVVLPAWISLLCQQTDMRMSDYLVWFLYGLAYTIFVVFYSLWVKPVYPPLSFRDFFSYAAAVFLWLLGFVMLLIGVKVSRCRARRWFLRQSVEGALGKPRGGAGKVVGGESGRWELKGRVTAIGDVSGARDGKEGLEAASDRI